MTNAIANNHPAISVEEIHHFVKDLPALLWRIEVVRARIDLLNDNLAVAPGIDGAHLLQNQAYRQQVMLPEDADVMEAFMEAVRQGQPASTVFRVKGPDGRTFWLQLAGATSRIDPGYYHGYLLNVDGAVSAIRRQLDTGLDLKTMVDDADNPMFFIDRESRKVVCANPPARNLLDITEADEGRLDLERICRQTRHQPLTAIFEKLHLAPVWTGSLSFSSMDRARRVEARTVLRHLIHKERHLVRFSLQQPQITRQVAAPSSPTWQSDIQALTGQLAKAEEIDTILSACHEFVLAHHICDAVLFSDIFVRKNIVRVYGSGQPFDAMPPAQSFAYKGTIAEEINRHNLDYLVVDDTQNSIKPIDWALFIPMGIRSYFAMPFTSRTVLRTVLILCATTPAAFSESRPDVYAPLLEAINEAIRLWRRRQRHT